MRLGLKQKVKKTKFLGTLEDSRRRSDFAARGTSASEAKVLTTTLQGIGAGFSSTRRLSTVPPLYLDLFKPDLEDDFKQDFFTV